MWPASPVEPGFVSCPLDFPYLLVITYGVLSENCCLLSLLSCLSSSEKTGAYLLPSVFVMYWYLGRLTGFLCYWPIGLELIAWQFEKSRVLAETAFIDYWRHLFALCRITQRIRGFTRTRYTNLLLTWSDACQCDPLPLLTKTAKSACVWTT